LTERDKDLWKTLFNWISIIKEQKNQHEYIRNNKYNTEFQIILLEHAPEKYWKEKNLTNFHLVDEFRNGNALIPIRAIKKS